MLQGKVIVITGGAGLIGKEFVRAVIQQNGIAVVADIDQNRLDNLKDSFRNLVGAKNIDTVH